MGISLKDFNKIVEKKNKTNKELLKFMEDGRVYSTNEIQKFLDINQTATLQRLKKLASNEYIELFKNDRIYQWKKIKEIEDKENYSGYGFYGY